MNMILGSFANRSDADAALIDLEQQGFDSDDISVITRENKARVTREGVADQAAGEGVASGAATGGIIGGIAGLLAGVGAIPLLGGLLIGGPIAAALGLTGAAATTLSGAITGALAGGLVGGLVDLGVPEPVARRYESTVREGGIIVGVPVPDASDAENEVRDTFRDYGATDIQEVALAPSARSTRH